MAGRWRIPAARRSGDAAGGPAWAAAWPAGGHVPVASPHPAAAAAVVDGSRAGRAAIDALARRLGLRVATAGLPHRLGGWQRTIDHIAAPAVARARLARRIPAARLSDHDAYVVDVTFPPAGAAGAVGA